MKKWMIYGAACYDIGAIRSNNEDACYFNGQHASFSRMNEGGFWTTQAPAEGTLWAVCDGMGGRQNGEIASYMAISGMKELQDHLKGRDFETTIQNWIRQANSAVAAKAAEGGTTIALAYFYDGLIQTAHIGDSRVYRFHNGNLIRLTRDHSKVEMLLAAGMIREDEAFHHPQRNVITRYLGMKGDYICEASIGTRQAWVDGDRYLLCSDGVCGVLEDREIANILASSENVRDCAEAIRNSVYTAGAKDNLTAIVLELEAVSDSDIPSDPVEEDILPLEDSDDEEPTERDD